MKRAIAMADNCIDVYYKMDRYYLTGNSIDFALNYKSLGGNVTEMTVLGNDVFADALVERLAQRGIPLRVLKRVDRPTGMAKMDLVDGDKKHLEFHGNAMEEIELEPKDLDFIRGFDIVYCERWTRMARYIRDFLQKTVGKGCRCAIAMLGEAGSLAWDGRQFYALTADRLPVVNTVGAGDSYIAAFTYGLSLDEDIPACMARGKAQANRIIQQFNPYPDQ